MLTRLDCTKCDTTFEPGLERRLCNCGGLLFARYDLEKAARDMRPGHLALRAPSLWRYREVLPVDAPQGRLILGEGFTPLLPVSRLGSRLGLPSVLIKDEGRNPTGSVEARGLAVAVSMARVQGATGVCVSSSEHAACAVAAYAARGGLPAHIFVSSASAPRRSVEAARAFGATVDVIEGTDADAAAAAAQRGSTGGWYDCTTLREPFRIEGGKTLGYEIAEQSGFNLPDALICPVGSGASLIAIWKAFDELEEMGFIGPGRPRLYAVQSSGCAPLVRAFEEGREAADSWPEAQTFARSLRVTETTADFLVLRALHKSRGSAVAVSDEEILEGMGSAAQSEGILLSPEGGATVAALRRLKSTGHITPDDVVVLVNPAAGARDLSLPIPSQASG